MFVHGGKAAENIYKEFLKNIFKFEIWSLPTSESSKLLHFELQRSESEISKWFESSEIFSSEIASTGSNGFKVSLWCSDIVGNNGETL